MRRLLSRFILSLFVLSFASSALSADAPDARPFLSPVFGDHMVLQRGKPNTFWGWTTPGAEVRVEVGDESAVGRADTSGRWQAQVTPPPAGGPYRVVITGAETRELDDVLVGDVWLCSGQSNMQFGLPRSAGGTEAVKAANHPTLRLFAVQQQPGYSPKTSVKGAWTVCTPESVAQNGGFSAVAYYFGRRLQADLNVPIGLIQAAVGGSPAESWVTPEGLKSFPEFGAQLREIDRLRDAGAPEYGNFIMHWYDEYEPGMKGTTWAAEAFDDSTWKSVKLPGGFAELGVPTEPSVCWFRREIVLPDPLPPGKATLRLGVVEKMDTSFINGTWVGASSWVENPRVYGMPDGVLRPGRNLIAVRVFKLKPDGGFQSDAADLRLVLGDGTSVPLAGEWKGRLSVDARAPHPLPLAFENYPIMPSVLHHGMIGPLYPLAITGAIWYQGEANTARAEQYRTLLPALIADWREGFGQGDFPFYIVSLPAFMARRTEPRGDGWAALREAQALTASSVSNTGLAVTIDTGDAADIHPTDKAPVGERLARVALAQHYSRDIPYSGPRFVRAERAGNALRLFFTNVSGCLVAQGDTLGEFSVAGADRKWHWAKARIDGETVIVSAPDVPEPIAARYAWQGNPLATLADSAGLPAHPFRTDDWPLAPQAP